MDKEQKTLFLFSQTCAFLGATLGNNPSATSKLAEKDPRKAIEHMFDPLYEALEKKLDEKLAVFKAE